MVRLITCKNRQAYPMLVRQMHADRKRVFVDMLGWDVPHDAHGEHDQFDDEQAEYLIVQDQATGEHLASLRLLRTDRPHLLQDCFADLCAQGVPAGPDIREVTRLCISPRRRAGDRLQARNVLIRSLVEYGLMNGIKAYTGVCEMGWLSQILAAGWDCRPLGLPRDAGGSLVGALIINITPATLNSFIPSWRCEPAQMRMLELEASLAA